MPPLPPAKKNELLAALAPADWARWLPQLEAVKLPLGNILYESGATLSHVYFPTTAIVSLLYVMENGASAEIAVVGNEGLVGISLFMGGESTPSRAVVIGLSDRLVTMPNSLVSPSDVRMRSETLREPVERPGAWRTFADHPDGIERATICSARRSAAVSEIRFLSVTDNSPVSGRSR